MKISSEERDIVSAALSDEAFLAKAAQTGIEGKDFDKKSLGWIFDKTIEYWKSPTHGNKIPTKKTLIKLLNLDKSLSDEIAGKYIHTIESIYNRKADDAHFSLDILSQYQLTRKFVTQLEKSAEALSNVGPDIAIKDMYDFLTSTYVPENMQIETRDWLDGYEQRRDLRKSRKENPETYRVLRFGIKELDVLMPRGVKPGEIAGVGAQTGIGKSIYCNHVAFHAILDSFDTTMFINENEFDQVEGRLDSLATGVPYDDLQLWRFDGDKKLLIHQADMMMDMLRNSIKSHLKIVRLLPKRHSVQDIRIECDRLRRKTGHKSEVIVIDSPDLMVPIGKYREYRLQQAGIYWEVWSYIKEMAARAFVSLQLKAEIEDPTAPENAAEAYDKSRLLDYLFILLRSKKQRLLGEASVAIAKSRDSGHSGEIVPLRTDLSRMVIDLS